MKKYFLLLFLLLFFIGCTSKTISKVEFSDDIEISDKNFKNVYIDFQNQTNEDVRLYKKLQKEFESKNFTIVNNIEDASYIVDLNLIFANEINKKSKTKDLLSRVDLGISVGHVFGNVGINGKIGTKMASILGDSLDTVSYQMIFDMEIEELEYENKESKIITQIIAERVMNEEHKRIIINILEDELAKKVVTFFQ